MDTSCNGVRLCLNLQLMSFAMRGFVSQNSDAKKISLSVADTHLSSLWSPEQFTWALVDFSLLSQRFDTILGTFCETIGDGRK